MPRRLDRYHFYEHDWDSYEELYEWFEWDVPEPFNLFEYLCERWADGSERVALHAELGDGRAETYTYDELATLSSKLADRLADLGVDRGDRVAVTAPQRPETLVTNLAAWKLGAISVPLAPQFGPDALEYRLADCGASVVVVDESSRETVRSIREDLDGLDAVLLMGEATGRADEHNVWRTLETGTTSVPTVGTAPDEDAMLIYTSGTTGNPKGVRTPHRLILGILPGFLFGHCNLEVGEDQLWRTPAGWGWMVFFVGVANLFYGKALLAREGRYDPETELELIEEYGVTNWFVPPTVLRMMMNEVDDPGAYDVGSVRTINAGGEAVGDDLLAWTDEVFENVTLNEGYGQSEALLVLTECGALFDRRDGMMGRPVPGHDVRIVDPETADPLDPGEVGEIALRYEDNPVVFNGYWNMPEKTAAKFEGDWLLTEDLGVADEDGYVGFHSRKDDVIICSGYRVGPEEVEEQLAAHDSVADAGVIGVPDDTRGRVPKAFVVPADGVRASEDLAGTLQTFVKERLAPYEYPRAIEFVDSLPTTPVSGKIRRTELRRREGLE